MFFMVVAALTGALGITNPSRVRFKRLDVVGPLVKYNCQIGLCTETYALCPKSLAMMIARRKLPQTAGLTTVPPCSTSLFMEQLVLPAPE